MQVLINTKSFVASVYPRFCAAKVVKSGPSFAKAGAPCNAPPVNQSIRYNTWRHCFLFKYSSVNNASAIYMQLNHVIMQPLLKLFSFMRWYKTLLYQGITCSTDYTLCKCTRWHSRIKTDNCSACTKNHINFHNLPWWPRCDTALLWRTEYTGWHPEAALQTAKQSS